MTNVSLHGATLRYGDRLVWERLDLDVSPGQFLAILGPNGAGKTSLLRVLLGLTPLSSGQALIKGSPARRGSPDIGYIPQQRAFDRGLPLRGRDLVRLGMDGNRFGFRRNREESRRRVDAIITEVGAESYANGPIGTMSGGEQQRLRVAQALVGDPDVLLCDEPLLSLDLNHQREVSEMIDRRRRSHGTSVVFVTHEINPILPYVDTVLYLVAGRSALGSPDEVFTSERLSSLYGTSVDVARVRGRIVVLTPEDVDSHYHPHGAADSGQEVKR